VNAVTVNGGACPDTFPKLLLRNADIFSDRPAMREKYLGIWQTWTWSDVLDEVQVFALGLKKMGLKRGDAIAIVGDNRPRLYWTFLAAQSLGAVPVPVFQDAVAEEMAYLLRHAKVSFVLAENQEQVDKVLSVSGKVKTIKEIIFDEERGLKNYGHGHIRSFDAVQELGRAELGKSAKAGTRWVEEIGKGKASDTSVILYTSGTTGASKGVQLSAGRCIEAASDTVKFDNLNENDVALAYLPLAWVGDHYLNFAQGMVAGFCLACPESPETVQEDLREIGPTFYFAPPRVFETMLTQIQIRMEDAGRFKQWLYRTAINVARRYGEDILNGKPVSVSGRLLYAIFGILVYGPLKNRLGFSRIRVAYTAGEAIGPDLFQFYRSLGLNLKQLYGQTEAFLYVTAQPDGEIYADTVGLPVPGVELRIADNGEVQFKSPGMFTGYFRDKKRTAEAMTSDGFVKTGDAGLFDAETGHLKIIDRADDVGKHKGGTLFAPKYIENKLKFFPYIREVVAYGDGREFCAVMLNINLVAVGNWAERHNIVYGSYQELAAHPEVSKIIEQNVDEVNQSLAGEPELAGSQIHSFLILHKELDADDGELTRTQKVRRGFIAERYAPLVKALYDGSKSCKISTEVTFEDGRKGVIKGDVKIINMKPHPVEQRKEAAE
jgi:long-chain acyl-CoA synthetase